MMSNINLTPIVQAIIALLAAIITYRLVPWIKARTTEQQQSTLKAVVKTLVYAAEQIYGAGNGARKLEYVCGELERRGYQIDLSEIEATVYDEMNMGWPMLRGRVEQAENNDIAFVEPDEAAEEEAGRE